MWWWPTEHLEVPYVGWKGTNEPWSKTGTARVGKRKAYEHNEDQEGAEQFQGILDEEAELIDGVLSRISELKILKGELERKRNEIERTQSHMLVMKHSKQL